MERKWYSHPGIELVYHLENTRDIGLRVFREKERLNFPFTDEELELSLSYMLVYHDIGKSTDYFQEYLRCVESGIAYEGKAEKKSHALLSAVYASYRLYEELTGTVKDILPHIVFLAVYKHHGNFTDLRHMSVITEFALLEDQWARFHPESIGEKPAFSFPQLKAYFKNLDEAVETIKNRLDYYFLLNFFFSILTYSDKSEAIFHRDMSGANRPGEMSFLVDRYKREKFRNPGDTGINRAREEIYRLCAEGIAKAEDRASIFAINVPTGSGKTLAVLNAALKLVAQDASLKRVIYAFPFTSIIDQAAEIMKEVFAINRMEHEDYLLVHHHLSEARIKIDEEMIHGERGQFIIENWEKPFILTTFWQFFNTLISNENQLLRKFHQLAGSVIILDEIQSFPYEYWKLINRVLTELTRLLNCKIIFLTATMPMIFSEAEGEIENLIEGEKRNGFFKSFSRYRLSLVRELSPLSVEELFTEARSAINEKGDKSFLFVFNTVKSSIRFFELAAEEFPGEAIIYLSANLLPVERKERIARIKEGSGRKIVISTQLIEAGVDIDLDVVFRDFSPLDSIVQAAGRCNRNNREITGEVYVFSLKKEGAPKKDSNYIYELHSLLPTEQVFRRWQEFDESELLEAVEHYYRQVREIVSKARSDELLKNISLLEYEEIGKNFQLIKQIPSELVFIEKDDHAARVLERFREIMEIADRFERRNQFLTIKRDFYSYTVSVKKAFGGEDVGTFREFGHFSIIPRHLVGDYYDENTGYKEPQQVIF